MVNLPHGTKETVRKMLDRAFPGDTRLWDGMCLAATLVSGNEPVDPQFTLDILRGVFACTRDAKARAASLVRKVEYSGISTREREAAIQLAAVALGIANHVFSTVTRAVQVEVGRAVYSAAQRGEDAPEWTAEAAKIFAEAIACGVITFAAAPTAPSRIIRPGKPGKPGR